MANPFVEQRDLAEGRAIVDLASRGVVTVTGPDRLSWLNSITSQELLSLAPYESTELLILDPTGRIEHAARVVDDGETTWLIADGVDAAGLAAYLDSMRFMLRVEVAERPDLAVIGSTVPLYAMADRVVDEEPPRAEGIPHTTVVWTDPWSQVASGGHQYAAGEHPGSAWRWHETIVTRDFAAGLLRRAAAGHVGLVSEAAFEALRIAAWRPQLSTEVDERSIPHELDWLRSAVHLSKGCYRGQETVAKVHNLGHPPRRLVMLHLDGSDNVLPQHGDPVLDGEAEAGRVTSAAQHYELGPIALAVVKRGVPVDAVLQVETDGVRVAAAQEVIVPPEAGATASVPRLPRLGARTRG